MQLIFEQPSPRPLTPPSPHWMGRGGIRPSPRPSSIRWDPTLTPALSRSERERGRVAGAVLLEVVLALLLFVATVAVVSGVLSSSMTGLERQRASVHAANLAVTVHSELAMGLRKMDAQGAQDFGPPFSGWTWELAPVPAETAGELASALTQIEVIIRSTNSPVVYRLTQRHKLQMARLEEGAGP